MSFSAQQREALERITGRGGVSVLIGQAGTGKGVVLSAASRAWQGEGYDVIGTAVAGATAKRLGADARLAQSLTTDALLHRAQQGKLVLNENSVVVMDEAGMADTQRLHELTKLTAERHSKLVLAGDDAQLSSIGAGGLFSEIKQRVPTAQLSEVHRAQSQWERAAWAQLREGSAERALASYRAHERPHIADTRQEVVEAMVSDWDRVRRDRPQSRTVMLTDASNKELDQINALAQQRRERAGELSAQRAKLKDRPYDLAGGDQVIFTAAFHPPGSERVDNGTLGLVVHTSDESRATIKTREATPREVDIDTEQFSGVRLAYAQHVYKAQGLTTERALVLTGGWQTDRERAYVALTRARVQTDVYVCREDLGEQGMDAGAIQRPGEAMAVSRAQEASIARPEMQREDDLQREPREVDHSQSEVGMILREQQERERERNRDVGRGIG